MKIYISIFFTLCLLSQSAEGKEAAYVTVADESGYTQIAVIDLENPQIVKYIPIGPDALSGNLVLTPDGNSLLLAGQKANKIYQIDIETDTVVDSMAIFQPYLIAMTPDSKYVLIVDWQEAKMSFIDWSQKQVIHEIEGPSGFASEMVITPDGRLVYLRGADQLTVIDVATRQVTESIPITGIRSLVWHKHERVLYAIDSEHRAIAKIDSSTHQIIDSIPYNSEGAFFHIRLNTCENKLYAATDIEHHIIDLATKKTIRRMPSIPSPPYSLHMPRGRDLAFTPNSKQVYLTIPAIQAIDSGSSTPGQVWIISTSQSVILYKLNIGFQPGSIAMVVSPPPLQGDFNSDQRVEFADFILFAAVFGTTSQDEEWNCNYDLIGDGKVDFADFLKFVQLFDGG